MPMETGYGIRVLPAPQAQRGQQVLLEQPEVQAPQVPPEPPVQRALLAIQAQQEQQEQPEVRVQQAQQEQQALPEPAAVFIIAGILPRLMLTREADVCGIITAPLPV